MTNDDIRQMCYRIEDALFVLDNMERLPNCNNCKSKYECEHCPVAGQMVRINCFAWVGENE